MLKPPEREVQTGVLVRRLEMASHLGEFLRRGILERIDGLFFVPDSKDRAFDRSRADAGRKFSNQAADDLPLLFAGVLAFVDQQVIDAEVQLVMHPRSVNVCEQLKRLVDQAIIIE